MNYPGQHIDELEDRLNAIIDAQAARIDTLTSALQQAADLIAIPAACHVADDMVRADCFTGTPRYSAGAMKHSHECFLLLPVLRAALGETK